MSCLPVFSYYSNLFFNKAYDRLLVNIARSEFGARTTLQLLCVAIAGLIDTFKTDLRFDAKVTYLVAVSNPMIALMEGIVLCNIILDSTFDIASSLIA